MIVVAVLILPPLGYYVVARHVLLNFGVVVPGQVYRAAQPDGEHLAAWIDEHGLRTVVNLRGEQPDDDPVYAGERRAAQEHHVDLVDIRFSALRLPPRHMLLRLIDTLETAERPIMLHCYAGADRTGVASVLAAMAIGGESYEQARHQLTIRYFHLGDDDTHIEGVFTEYEAWCREQGRPTAGWEQFRDWARQTYRTAYYYVLIDTPETITANAGQTVDMACRFTNDSHRVLPASDARRAITAVAYRSATPNANAGKVLGKTRLPAKDLAPGESIDVNLALTAPDEPQRVDVIVDLFERGDAGNDDIHLFAHQGSPVHRVTLIVEPGDN